MTQQMAVQLPPDVAGLAYQRQLGPHFASYLPKRASVLRLAGLGVFIVSPFALAVLAAVHGVWLGTLIGVGFGLFFGSFLLRAPNFNRKLAARRVYVFEHGFIHADGSGALADYRWDAIAWLTQRITNRYVNGIHVGTFYVYTVARKDGPVLKLTEFYDGIAQLGRTISEQVTRDKLPGAVALLQQGQTVGFGDLGISTAGIVSTKHGLLPWTELDEVKVVQGYVKLRRAGKWLPWSNKPAAAIPNLYVFLTLADQLQRAAHGG
ncbi:MAG: hypothetical protein AUI14_00415 [Actinobacteria bacterium 13_2_20CM_2_71_6]|nr:MAG: hypothetical protein AUI14_00415 [Actinobacteria bacterium 13_2_20CM_2_71_6]